MKITKDPKTANAITHGGTFHADEVMSTVILDKVQDAVGAYELVVCRMNRYDPYQHDPGATVYDIGGGRYDHHQRGGNGARINGVPYSSCGLIWKCFGMYLCKNCSDPEALWKSIDRELIQPIDAVDCGTMPRSEYPIQPLTLSGIISSFNPNWDENRDLDDAFVCAYKFAADVFDRIFNRTVSKIEAGKIVYASLDKMENHIMVLDKYVPWVDYILAPDEKYAAVAADVLYVVYPAHRGGFQWRTVPDREGSYGMRKPAPFSWWGASTDDLRRLTDTNTAVFCHPNGFIGGAETLEDTIAMARKAVEA